MCPRWLQILISFKNKESILTNPQTLNSSVITNLQISTTLPEALLQARKNEKGDGILVDERYANIELWCALMPSYIHILPVKVHLSAFRRLYSHFSKIHTLNIQAHTLNSSSSSHLWPFCWISVNIMTLPEFISTVWQSEVSMRDKRGQIMAVEGQLIM